VDTANLRVRLLAQFAKALAADATVCVEQLHEGDVDTLQFLEALANVHEARERLWQARTRLSVKGGVRAAEGEDRPARANGSNRRWRRAARRCGPSPRRRCWHGPTPGTPRTATGRACTTGRFPAPARHGRLVVHRALNAGTHGLPGGDTLAKLPHRERGRQDGRGPLGVPVKRAEAQRLRAEGWTVKAIGAPFGVSRQTAEVTLRRAALGHKRAGRKPGRRRKR
jgi:hypothetical protein